MIYRQRFTITGQIGAILFVAAPVALVLAVKAFLDRMDYVTITNATGSALSVPDAPLVPVAVCLIGWLISCAMLLVGREYYRIDDDDDGDD